MTPIVISDEDIPENLSNPEDLAVPKKPRRKKKPKRHDRDTPIIVISDDEEPDTNGDIRNSKRKRSEWDALEEGEVDDALDGVGGEGMARGDGDREESYASRKHNGRERSHRDDRSNGHSDKRQRDRSRDARDDCERDGKDRGNKDSRRRRRTPSPSSLFCIDTKPGELKDKCRTLLPPPPFGSSSDVEILDPKASQSENDNALLLPANVSLSVGEPSSVKIITPSLPAEDEDDFIRYMDYDEDTQKGITRYFDETKDESMKYNTFKCKHCGAEGDHKSFDCPVVICLTCGARDEHSTRGCPISKTCFSCGMKGHINRDCPQRYSSRAGASMGAYDDCERCGSDLHKVNECPTLWRMYEYVSDAQREAVLSSRKGKEALAFGSGGEGYFGEDEWCYHCGGDGHLGDDCNEVDFPRDFPKEPSAFSLYNTMSGPFADSDKHRSVQRRRLPREWEEDGVFDDGYGFAGPANVGRKGKDKERARMQNRVREEQEAEDDGDDWFGRQRNQSRGAERPQSNGGRSRDKDGKDRHQDRKPVFQLSIKGQASRHNDSRLSHFLPQLPERPKHTSSGGGDRYTGPSRRQSNDDRRNVGGDIRSNGYRDGRRYHGGYSR